MNITKTEYEILFFMCQRPETEWHVRGLARDAGISHGAASQGLLKLERLGLMYRKKKGNMLFYRLHDEKPVIHSFKKAFTLLGLEPLVGRMKEISERIVLFGSAAEGTEGNDSDIDLLIITTQKSKIKGILRRSRTVNRHPLNPVVLTPSELLKLSRTDRPFYERAVNGTVLWRRSDE